MKSPRLVVVTLVGSLLLAHLAVCRVLPNAEDGYGGENYDDGYYYDYYYDTQEGETAPEHLHHEPAAVEPVAPHPVEVPVETVLQENATEPTVNVTVPAPPVPAAPVPHKIPKSCTQPPDAGTCRGYFPMFYFDPNTKTCLPFVYGGCRGTANVYKTSSDCYANCYPAGLLRSTTWKKGEFLTLHDGSGPNSYVLKFPGHDAAIRVDDQTLVDFSMSKVYQIDFYFRTDMPHGLIAFLRQSWVPLELEEGTRIHLYVYLKRGRLGVTHIFGHEIETFTMRKGGLQGGNWHSGLVKVDATTGHLVLEVDGHQETFTIPSLAHHPNYHEGPDVPGLTHVWIGGVFRKDLEKEEVTGGIIHFHGCLKKVGLMSGDSSSTMTRIMPLRSAQYQQVTEKCTSNCNDPYRNRCSPSSHCVEHFDHSTCNCFKSDKDGRRCDIMDLPVITLNGEGYVVHRIYDWMDRVHSYNNLISLQFMTRFTNSILFYASAEHPERQFLAVTLTAANAIYVEANFGSGSVGEEIEGQLNHMTWNTLTLVHQHDTIQIYLNSLLERTLVVPGDLRYLHLDPDIYIGNAPNLTRYCGLPADRGNREGEDCQQDLPRFHYHAPTATCLPFNYSGCGGNDNSFLDYDTCMSDCHTPGLRSLNIFVGCLRNVYFNDVSILYELQQGNKTTRYIGMTSDPPINTTCTSNEMLLLTLATEEANFNLTNPNPDNFRIVVSFKPTQPTGVVASGFVDIMDTKSEWELRHDKNFVYFYIHDNLVNLKSKTKISIGHWQYVDVSYSGGRIRMRMNQNTVTKTTGPIIFSSSIAFGLNLVQGLPGLVGCLRTLEVGGVPIDLRSLVGTSLAHRDVIYDNCQVLRPCERPGACEHGAKCSETEDGVKCDCTGTGYTGSKCHFSLYKRSCEQYRQIGHNTSGIYKIDVDGNGPMHPSYVKCVFNSHTGETTTVVEHNLIPRFRVRRLDLDDMQIQVKYRDFCPHMLKSLISQSKWCTQEAKYECRRAPLSLSTHTWFSSPSQSFISNFGSKTAGLCRCKEVDGCDEPDVPCNCDVGDGMPRSDQAVTSDPRFLPTTSIIFLQDRRMEEEDSEGLFTLGPLMCTRKEANSHTVSFNMPGTFLEIPAWREGSLFLIFRTTTSRAVIAYQPAYHPSHATFRIALVGERTIEFMYKFHGHIHRHHLTASRPLNTGQWQQVLIDIHDHQARLLVNSEQLLLDLDRDAYLGVLDGSMFLAGVPPYLLTEELKEEGLEGLEGCIRSVTMNDEVVNLLRYIRAAPHGVSPGCNPSCDPNPCRNGATCLEKWGSYECVCSNPLAHSGKNCEHDDNQHALTFTTEDSRLRYFSNDTESMDDYYNLLNSSFSIGFRTHADSGLLLFAVDSLHNFLQLHLAGPETLVLLFNSGKNFHELSVVAGDGVVFNNRNPVQVAVERKQYSTSMTVYNQGALFNATMDTDLLMIQEDEYEQLPFGDSKPVPEMVYYPHSVTRPYPFYQMFLGSATDRSQDTSSLLPGLVGCIRGLKIEDELVPLESLVNEGNVTVSGVVTDCKLACDLQPCLHGGVCTEDFQYFNNFRCDCTDTSYSGPTCNTETAYSFFGREWISRTASVSPIMEDVEMRLAFSASTRRSQPQLVAFLRSTNPDKPSDYMLVAVEPDGALLLEAQLEDLDSEYILGARLTQASHGVNTFNGQRHYVVMKWHRDGLTIHVDREEREVHLMRRIILTQEGITTTPTGLYLGGIEEDIDHRLHKYGNFHGCISNVHVTNPVGEAVPLLEYSQNDYHLRAHGMPGLGSCDGFSHMMAPALVMTYGDNLNVSAVMGPEWAYEPARALGVKTVPADSSHPERDTPMDDVVPIVCGVIFAVVIIAVVLFLLCTKKKKDDKKKKMGKEEETPRRTYYSATVNGTRTKELTVMDKSELVPLKSAPDGIVQGDNAAPTSMPPVVETTETALQKEEEEKQEEAKEPEEEEEAKVPEEEEVVVPRTGDSADTGDRPLSWDKATDNLPLIIGAQDQPKAHESESDNSSESSIDCTINITGSPSSSPTLQRDTLPSVAESSPSSTRVQVGSRGMLYIDEGMDTEPETPTLLRHEPLSEFRKENSEKQMKHPDEEGQLEISEEEQDSFVFEAEERQRIVKSDDENEYVIVDDVNISESIPGIQLIEEKSDTRKADNDTESSTVAREQEQREEKEEKAEKPVLQEEETHQETTATNTEVVPEALSKTKEGESIGAEVQEEAGDMGIEEQERKKEEEKAEKPVPQEEETHPETTAIEREVIPEALSKTEEEESKGAEVQEGAGDMGIEEPIVKKEAIIQDMVGPDQVPEYSLIIEEPQAKEADAVPSGSFKIEETVAEIEKIDDGSPDLQVEDQPEPKETITPEAAFVSEPPPPEASGDALNLKEEEELPEGKAITDTKKRDSSSSSSSSDKVADEDFDDFPPPPPPPPLEITEESAPGERASGSTSSSDDEFVEVRPERENVQDAQRMSSQTLQQNDVDIPSQSDSVASKKMDEGTEDDDSPKSRPTVGGNIRGSVSDEGEVNLKGTGSIDQKDDGFSDKEEVLSENEKDDNDVLDSDIRNVQEPSERDPGGTKELIMPVIIISEHEDQVCGEEEEMDESTGKPEDTGERVSSGGDDEPVSDDKESSVYRDKPDEFQNHLEAGSPLHIEEAEEISGENESQDSIPKVQEEEADEELAGIHEDSPTPPTPESDSMPTQLSEEDMLLVRQLPLAQGNSSECSCEHTTTPEGDTGALAEAAMSKDFTYTEESKDVLDHQHGLPGDLEGAIGGETTPLEPISEQDESDEDNTAASGPGLFKSKLSSGMTNLSTIGSDRSTGECSPQLEHREEEPLESTSRTEEEDNSDQSPNSSNDESSSNESSREEGHPADEAPADATTSRQPNTNPTRTRRTGRITKSKKNPIFLSEAMRTFSNPISYLGGPNIEYEGQEEQATRTRNDSVCSTTSID